MVSKENYEIWMIDYLDGNLSDADQELLFQFLDKNPTLKEELDGLDHMVLKPIEESFDQKQSLLKSPAHIYDMDYPDYIATKEVEEGLNHTEQEWKTAYLKEDKEHSKLFSLYAKTILKTDHRIRYQLKGNLKRAKLIPIFSQNTFKKISVAATIAILLSVGAMPFLQKSAETLQTVAVNTPPSLITMPKTNKGAVKSNTPKKTTVNTKPIVSQNKKSITIKEPEQTIQREAINPITKKAIQPFKTRSINAYEMGLNSMMPIIIANNLVKQEQNQLAMQSQVKLESQKLTRSAKAIASGIKVINFLSGNETKMKQVLNQDGQMIAYQVESDNIFIKQKIKN